jgi:hypothetical protein
MWIAYWINFFKLSPHNCSEFSSGELSRSRKHEHFCVNLWVSNTHPTMISTITTKI